MLHKKLRGLHSARARSNKKILDFTRNIAIRPERLFLLLGIPFGIISIFVMPPFMVPDENAHLYRAYQVSEGQFISSNQGNQTGADLPLDIKSILNKMYVHSYSQNKHDGFDYGTYLFNKINLQNTGFIGFSNTAVYSPVGYIPQAIGVGIARIIFPSELAMLYMGRLCNLAAYLFLIYLAVKIAPVKKWVFVVAALFPVAIQQAASLSSDVATIGLCFVAVAYCMYLFKAKRIARKQVVCACIIAAGLGLTKQANVLLLIPFLFLPSTLFGDKWRKAKFSSLLLLVGFGTAIAWYLLIKHLHYELDYSGTPGVDMAGQIHFLLSHPLSYVKLMFTTFIYNSSLYPPPPDAYWFSAVGVFSWLKYQLPVMYVILAYLLLFVALIHTGDSAEEKQFARQSAWFRLSLIATFFIGILATATLLYLVWTPVGQPVIAGIQGRYFIPLIPLLAGLFLGGRNYLRTKSPYTLPVAIAVISALNFSVYVFQTIRYFN